MTAMVVLALTLPLPGQESGTAGSAAEVLRSLLASAREERKKGEQALEESQAQLRKAEAVVAAARQDPAKPSHREIIERLGPQAIQRAQANIEKAKRLIEAADGKTRQAEKALHIRAEAAAGRLAVAKTEIQGEQFSLITADGVVLTGPAAVVCPLDARTRIATGGETRVTLRLPDDTTFVVGPNSDLMLDEFVYDPVPGTMKTVVKVTKGVFRWMTGKVGPRPKLDGRIRAASIAVGLRGTDVEVVLDPTGACRVKLFDGEVEISDAKGAIALTLRPGQMVDVDRDGIPGKPVSFDP